MDPQVWQYMNSLEVGSGRLLEPADKFVAVIGSGVASGIYKKDIGINQIISINGKSVRVVGILKEQGGSEDRQIYMPIDAAVNVITDAKKDVFDSIQVKARSVDVVDTVSAAITTKLMISRHNNSRWPGFFRKRLKIKGCECLPVWFPRCRSFWELLLLCLCL